MDETRNHCGSRRYVSRAVALNLRAAAGALLLLAGNAWATQPTIPPAAGPMFRVSPGDQPTPPARSSANPVRDFTTYVPTAKATRIEAAEAPVIDGDLSDAVWAKAQVIDEFYQIEPDTGQPGSERTELRFLYDADNLYIAV